MPKAKKTWDIHAAVDCIADWAYTDSRLTLDRKQLHAALEEDFSNVGRLPTEKECEVFVCGTDEGDIPDELTESFVQTHGFLQSHF